ncbi:MAG: methyltransferase/glycosyl transferase fusion [Geobacteraceae bacterium]|nr:MAG: methyltransferase/glycosyl transferase fusion [Geobacteraceae bacterium]
MKIHLIVQYYKCDREDRQQEIDSCLVNNLQNPYISMIHLLTEEQFDLSQFPNQEKIGQTVIKERLTFEKAFQYANQFQSHDFWMLANADIYFDESLLHLQEANLDNSIFALTRHDVQKDGSIKLVDAAYAHGSQDAWIFKTPVPLDRIFAGFCLGIPGCDNRIAYEFVRAGYYVINPSLKIIIRHLDLTREVDINARAAEYLCMHSDENFRLGKVAPPPHMGEIFPTSRLDFTGCDEYDMYHQTLKEFAEHIRYVTELKQETAQLKQETAELKQETAELKQEVAGKENVIAFLHNEISDKDTVINNLLNSYSWKITQPLRWCASKLSYVGNSSRLLAKLVAAHVRDNGGGIKGLQALLKATFAYWTQYGFRGTFLRTRECALNLQQDSIERAINISSKYSSIHLNDHSIMPHTTNLDIVICVHNALSDVKECLNSVVRYSFPPYSIIIVDDGSNDDTRDYLKHFADNQGAILIRNESARGYTFAANQGLRASQGEYVVLLNSDTIVTQHWLDRMVMCAESDPAIGLVGPLSNTASWQSIPEIFDEDGDWSANPLTKGMNVDEMCDLVAAWSERVYPRITLLNGFCIMIKRQVVSDIGYFDEETFAKGYGEENDYCLRARAAGWTLAIADDVYIYHAQSKSYSHERRSKLSAEAGVALAKKHGKEIIDDSVEFCTNDKVLLGLRSHAKLLIERQYLIEKARKQWEGKRVVFILPIREACGGANVVISEAQALRKFGVDCRILNLAVAREDFERSYHGLDVPVIYAPSRDEVHKICQIFDVVIATSNTSVPWLVPLINNKQITLGYYIQDYEPFFYNKGTKEYNVALESYNLIPDMTYFTKTEWNKAVVREQVGRDCHVIGPSCNVALFRPRVRRDASWPDRPIRIVAMIRPNTPRRNPLVTMELLREVSQNYGDKVDIIVFGVSPEDPDFLSLPRDFAFRNVGFQSSTQLALLFNEADIFADFSTFQAMGLTAMEAMACGVAVIVPKSGGSNSFALHEQNALLVDTSSKANCMVALNHLIANHKLRLKLQTGAIKTIAGHYPEKSAYNIMNILKCT